jgi:gamma-carbonic anhydrase
MRVLNSEAVTLTPYQGTAPRIHESVFLADGVRILGDVELKEDVSVWFNTVIRGDVNRVSIGEGTNIQDQCCLHVEHDRFPLILKKGITVGHQVTLHGCTIESYCLVGMGAIIMNGVIVGSESIVAAGALIPENTIIPPRSLVLGIPAKVQREIRDSELERLHSSYKRYIQYSRNYQTMKLEP